jgi:hypothetical protein
MLIEDLRNQMDAEIRTARQSARRAEQAAEAERSKYLWSKKNPTFAMEANFNIMETYLANAGILVSEDSLNLALRAVRNNLAERVLTPVVPELTAEEKRETENNRLRSMSREELRAEVQANMRRQLATPEYGGHGSTFTPSFTAEEFKRMSPSQVKALIFYEGSRQERPGVRAGLDKLLRDAQLLKESKSN